VVRALLSVTFLCISTNSSGVEANVKALAKNASAKPLLEQAYAQFSDYPLVEKPTKGLLKYCLA